MRQAFAKQTLQKKKSAYVSLSSDTSQRRSTEIISRQRNQTTLTASDSSLANLKLLQQDQSYKIRDTRREEDSLLRAANFIVFPPLSQKTSVA